MLRCVYVDLDLHAAGSPRLACTVRSEAFTLPAPALEACVVVPARSSSCTPRRPAEARACSACAAWIERAALLVLDGEEHRRPPAWPTPSARHLRARACDARGRDRASARSPALEPVVGTFWLAGRALDDPLLRLELEERPRTSAMAEERGPAAFYEAVVTDARWSGGIA